MTIAHKMNPRPLQAHARITIMDALDDEHLFRRFFRDAETWLAWRVFLCALFALPMSEQQLAVYRQCTGRDQPPTDPCTEAWLVIGRRGGKSFVLALIAVFLACFHDWRRYLNVGERGTVMIIAADRKQARVIMRYIKGLISETPMLKPLIENETQESLDLNNRITLEVHTASLRSTRGYTIVAALLDELAFWPTDEASAEPDTEVIAAIKPGMSTIPGAMLLCASSPYARRGTLYNAYRKHYGQPDDPVLVWQAPTRTMNPTVPESLIAQALDDDPAHAQAEYLAQFRCDIESFVSIEAVRSCVNTGILERPPRRGVSYFAFCDPSGGSADSMTLCIAHREIVRQIVVIDALLEIRPPFSPELACRQFAETLRSYGIFTVVSDKYAGAWVVEQFDRFGIVCEQSADSKSSLYQSMLPLINSARISLLDHPRLISQITCLERRTSRVGRDSIDHPPGGHDDLANAVAGVAITCVSEPIYNLDAMI